MSTNHGGTRLLPPQEQELGWSKERRVVQAEAQSRLRNSGYRALRHVSCDFHEGVLTLRGQVPSFYLKPVALILTRQDVPTLDRSRHASAEGLRRGAYILAEAANGGPEVILIATGSEVHLIVEARLQLQKQNIQTRLVSMPSWELFDTQTEEYRRSVFPQSVRARLAVEAGATQGWHRYIGQWGDVIGLDHFSASAPGPVLMREFGFTAENVCTRARALLGRNKCLIAQQYRR